MAVSIHSVADYFIRRAAPDAGDPMTHLKLQKLAYYAQAWSLALEGQELFQDDFEAWVHGPVARSLYDRFASFGWNPITPDTCTEMQLPEEVAAFLDEVWEVYGQYSAKRLEDLTHDEAPWVDARGDLDPLARCSHVISKDVMREYYSAVAAEAL